MFHLEGGIVREGHDKIVRKHVPGCGAVSVEGVEVLAREELASVDPRLDGAQTSEDTHLLHVAHQRDDVESLQLRVYRV